MRHHPAVAGDIGGKDGGEMALHGPIARLLVGRGRIHARQRAAARISLSELLLSTRARGVEGRPTVPALPHKVGPRQNRPARKSAIAWLISARVFMTNGP